MKLSTMTIWAIVGVLAAPRLQAAQTPELTGNEIAAEASRRASGFGDFSATLRMIVRNGRGGERVRELTLKVIEIEGEGERTLVRFERPRDLRGTAFLSVSDEDGSSDQWLYLPALRRVKRIAQSSRSGSFMGTEFAYADVATIQPDQFTHRLLRSDTLDDKPSWVVERTPLDPSSHYRRQVVWFDQDEYRLLKVDYYDRNDTLLKTLRLSGLQLHANAFWRPGKMEMVNHRTGASTVLEWSEYVFTSGLTAVDFTPDRLRQGM